MTMTMFKGGAVFAAMLLASAAFAQADMAPPPPPSRATGPAARPDEGGWASIHEAAKAKREADLALLLDLRPQQQALLHAFLASMDDGAGGPRPDHMPPPHGPDEGRFMHDGAKERGAAAAAGPDGEQGFAGHLADMQAHLDRHTQREQARLAAARAFYAALDTRQQQKFEAIQRLHRSGHHDGPPPPPGDDHGPAGDGPMHGPHADRGLDRDGPSPRP